MVLGLIKRINDSVKEFGFYIFLAFATFIITLFESFIPRRILPQFIVEQGLKIQRIIAERLNDRTYLEEVILKNPYIVFLLLIILVLIFIGIITFFLFLYFKLTGRNFIKIPRSYPYPYWNYKDLIKILIWIFFYFEVLSVATALFQFLFKYHQTKIFWLYTLLSSLLLDLIIFFLLAYWLYINCKQNFKALGIEKISLWRNIRLGFFSYFAFFPVLFFLVQYSVKFIEHRGVPFTPQPILFFLLMEQNPYILLLAVLFIVLIGPITEELLFRGLLYTSLKKAIGVYQAMFISAIFFSLLHMNIMGFLPILGLGLLFAYIYEKTGSLTSAITMHIIHNSFMLSFLIILRYIARL